MLAARVFHSKNPAVSSGMFKCRVDFMADIEGAQRIVDTFGALYPSAEAAEWAADQMRLALTTLGVPIRERE